MSAEKTENLGLTIYSDITDVYQRELRQSYLENFKLIDSSFLQIESDLKSYVDTVLGGIENGSY